MERGDGFWYSQQNLHEKFFLLAIARFFIHNDDAYTRLSEVEELYAIVCEEFEEEPNSHTQIWKYAKLLSALGIIKIQVTKTEKRGRSTKISLPSIPAKELEKELHTILKNKLE